MIEEFPPNTRAAKAARSEDRPKVQRVVQGEVVMRKKPVGRRILETFFGSDDARGVVQYVVLDVLVPATKDMIADAGTQALERALFGESRPRSSSSSYRGPGGHTNYNRASSPIGRGEPRRELSDRSRARHDFGELVFPTRAEANEVLDTLFGIIKDYGTTSVADLYEAAGYSGQFVDENWGWEDLRGSQIHRVRGGYIIKLPPTHQL